MDAFAYAPAMCLWRQEEGFRSPGTGLTESLETPCACWEMTPAPLQEQPMLLSHLSSSPPPFYYKVKLDNDSNSSFRN